MVPRPTTAAPTIATLIATLAALTALAPVPARSQDAPVTRTPLQAAEAPAAAHAVQSFLVTVAPHATIAPHTHPGLEVGYVVAGTATVSLSGQPDRAVSPGDSWAFPAGAVHSLVNTGDTPARLVVTYVVEAGRPLSTPAP